MHLRFGHLQAKPADLGGQTAFVVAGTVCLPPSGTLVSDTASAISSASASNRSSLVSSRFWSICMMFEGLGSVSCFLIAVFVLANENRTQDADHTLLRQNRNTKVRNFSDVRGCGRFLGD